MLLAGLQGKPVGRIAILVDGNADDAARDRALVFVFRGEIGGMRTTEAQRHAEALAGADGDISAELARRGEVGQRQQVGGDYSERALGMGLLDDTGIIMHGAVGVRILQQDGEGVFRQGGVLVADHHGQPGRCGAGL